MEKEKMLKEIQKRLPDGIIIEDATKFDFTEDEFVSILCWLQYFRAHYAEYYGKNDEQMSITLPIISKRLRLDFTHYRFIQNSHFFPNFGKYIVYITANTKRKKIAVKHIINCFSLQNNH